MKASLLVKDDCTLCEKAHVILQRIAVDLPMEIEVVRLEQHPEFVGTEVPAVFINGQLVATMKVSEYRLRTYLRRFEGGSLG